MMCELNNASSKAPVSQYPTDHLNPISVTQNTENHINSENRADRDKKSHQYPTHVNEKNHVIEDNLISA